MADKKTNQMPSSSQTTIGFGALLEGSLKAAHNIRVDGNIKGKIVTDGVLIVGTTGILEAEIDVNSTVIGGKVVGQLNAREKIELEQNASVIGELKTKDLIINEGAVFQGSCSMSVESRK